MADDIDATIRILRKNGNTTSVLGIAMLEAADEIERLQRTVQAQESVADLLRAKIAQQHDEIERLRGKCVQLEAAGDALAAMYWAIWQGNETDLITVERPYFEWKKARPHG